MVPESAGEATVWPFGLLRVDTNVSLGFDNKCHRISPTHVTASEGNSKPHRAGDGSMPVAHIGALWFLIPAVS
jgi:hypothetical protein